MSSIPGNAVIIVGPGVELVKLAENKYEARLAGGGGGAPPPSPSPQQPTASQVKNIEFKFNGEIVIAEGLELVKLAENKYEVTIKQTPQPQPPSPEPSPEPTPPTPVATQPQMLGTIEVQNLSTMAQDADIQTWIAAVQKQVDEHVAPAWNMTTKLVWLPKGQLPTAGNAQAGFFDNTDTPGAAAWHDVGPNGEPLIKMFMDAGGPSVSFSHEICETISDWDANTTVKGIDDKGRQCLYYQESCDPVESNTYQIDGVDVSNFVTPNWFNELPKDNNMDYLKVLAKQFQIASGGYMELSYDNGQSWTQVNKNSQRKHMHQSPHSRWALYKKKSHDRVKSTFKMKPKH